MHTVVFVALQTSSLVCFVSRCPCVVIKVLWLVQSHSRCKRCLGLRLDLVNVT